MQKIFTAIDRAKELGFVSTKDFITAMALRNNIKWDGRIDKDEQKALIAYIDAGRWAVECECGQPAYADPDYPFAFCALCGNAAIGSAGRSVIFPNFQERHEIEAALLEREIDAPLEIGTQTIGLPKTKAKVEGAHRAWKPGQKTDDLRKEHEFAKSEKHRREKEEKEEHEKEEAPTIPAVLNDDKPKKAGK